jgi:hypothetical protein
MFLFASEVGFVTLNQLGIGGDGRTSCPQRHLFVSCLARFGMLWSRERSSRLLCAIAALLAVTILCAPRQSQASCGDYLMPSFGHNSAATSKDSADAMPGMGHRQDDRQRDPHQPCSGPNCSKRPLPQAPIPTSPAPVQDLAALFFMLTVVAPEPLSSTFQAPSEKPTQSGSPVFHPPRPTVVLL